MFVIPAKAGIQETRDLPSPERLRAGRLDAASSAA